MKKTDTPIIYVKDKEAVLINTNNLFVYHISIFAYHKKYFSLCNDKYFSSEKEVKGIIQSFFINPYIEIYSELYSAPEKWLREQGFRVYVKPEKIKKIKKQKENDK